MTTSPQSYPRGNGITLIKIGYTLESLNNISQIIDVKFFERNI